MSLYITKHAIKRFYERFPKEWKKLKCVTENWQETSKRHYHNVHVLQELFGKAQEIKHINNHQGYLIWQQERHNKNAKYYLYKDIVFIADADCLYTVLDKNQALPHICNVKTTKIEVINTRYQFEQLMESGHPSFDYAYLTTLNEYYDIYEVKNHVFSDFVRINRYNFSEKHKLTEYEYSIVDTILLWNKQDEELIEKCIANPEEYCMAQCYDNYIFHWRIDGISLYWSYNTIEHHIQVLWGTELMKVLVHIQEKDFLETVDDNEPVFCIHNFAFYERNKNFILMHGHEKVSDITGRDFQLFNAVKYMIEHSAPGYASFNAFLADSVKEGHNVTFFDAINKYIGRYLYERARPTVWSNVYMYEDIVLFKEESRGMEIFKIGGENTSSMLYFTKEDIHEVEKNGHYKGSWHNNTFYEYNGLVITHQNDTYELYGLPFQKKIITVENIVLFYQKWFNQKRFDIIGGVYDDAFIVKLSHISQTQKKYIPDFNEKMLALWNPRLNQLRPIHKDEYIKIESVLEKNAQLRMWLANADIVDIKEMEENELLMLHVIYKIGHKMYECHLINNDVIVQDYSGNNSIKISNGSEDGSMPSV